MVRVGVDGRLQNPGRKDDPRGDSNPDPFCMPHEAGPTFILPSCKPRIDATSSLMELNDPPTTWGLLGEIGGESDCGDIGGEAKIDVGEE